MIGFGYIEYSTTSETGYLQIGERVIGSISGAEAFVAFSDPGSFHIVELINQAGFFVTGDILVGQDSGKAATIVSYSNVGIGDTYSWTDGIVTNTQQPISDKFALQSNDSIYFNWVNYIGHIIGDQWTFALTSTPHKKLQIAQNSIQIGDVEGAYNFDRLNINVSDGINELGSSTSMTFRNTYPLQGARPLLSLVSGSSNLITIGDKGDAFNGFYSEFDLPNGVFDMKFGGVSGYHRVKFDLTNLYYRIGDHAANESYLIIDGVLHNSSLHATGTITLGDVINAGNSTRISIDDVNQLIKITNIPSHADDAAAITAGLTAGHLYKTTSGGSTFLKIVP